MNVSKSTICNISNYQFPNIIQPKKSNRLYEKIIDIFNWLKSGRGRKGVADILIKKEELRVQIDKLVELWINFDFFVVLE